MTLSRQHVLTLPANPRAVKLAREWVGKVLGEISRDDLVYSAELAVSELVTNAIMHSTPPVAVRVRGTQAHPRIEVADRSLVPPRPNDDLALDDEDDLLLTFGRGLTLVAVHSAAWGSDIDEDGHGKTVWFEPVAEPDPDVEPPSGDVFDLAETLDQLLGGLSQPDTFEVRLLKAPVTAFVEMRRHYNELRRELRLLALTNPHRYPLAVEFSDTAMQAEQERRQSSGIDEAVARADHDGLRTVDLVAVVPVSTVATMARLRHLHGQVLAFFEAESLLAALPTPRQVEVQNWYLDEVVRQGAGEAPRAWSGGYTDHSHQSAS